MSTIDPRVDIGHVHLKVADIERSLAFYTGVLGFELQQRLGDEALRFSRGRLSPSHRPEYLAEQGRFRRRQGHDGALSCRDPLSRPATLADALRRLIEAEIPLAGASDHGVSEALYLRTIRTGTGSSSTATARARSGRTTRMEAWR